MHRRNSPPRIDHLRIVGDRPAVNFVNTIDPREGDDGVDYLGTYLDLTLWAVQARVITRHDGARLIRAARRDRSAAGQVLNDAKTLRDALYRTFSALATPRRPGPSDL